MARLQSILSLFGTKPAVATCGALCIFGFAPFHHSWLLAAAYLIFVHYLYSTPNIGSAMTGGFLFGLSHFLIGLHWIFSIGEQFDSQHKVVISVLLLGIIFVLAALFSLTALAIYLVKPEGRHNFVWCCIVVPTVFCLFEWLRTWLFTGFPWFQAGQAFIDMGLAPLLPAVGILGVSFYFYLIVGAIYYLSRNFLYKAAWLRIFVLAVCLASTIAIAARTKWTQPKPDLSFTAQLIHDDTNLGDKTSRSKTIDRIVSYQNLSLLEPVPDLTVWPESTVSHEYHSVKKYIAAGFEDLSQKGVKVIMGAYVERLHNTVNAVLDGIGGKILYTKQHLLPFGEYMPSWFAPLGTLLPSLRMDNLTADRSRASNIRFKGIELAPSICFEILFGDELRRQANKAHVQVHFSDLGWFDNSWVAPYLLEVARVRTMETRKPMIYATNYGHSAFIDHQGKVVQRRHGNGPVVLYGAVVPYQGSTWYSNLGSSHVVAFCATLFLLGFGYLFFQSRSFGKNRETK